MNLNGCNKKMLYHVRAKLVIKINIDNNFPFHCFSQLPGVNILVCDNFIANVKARNGPE
jgi:hypothetical protein